MDDSLRDLPVMRRGLTLVAYYGLKHDGFAGLLREVQNILRSRLGETYRPYTATQVHATIVGIRDPSPGGEEATPAGSQGAPDLAGLLEYLTDTTRLPLTVRIGGFKCDEPAPFLSRGKHPHERSISLQPDGTVVGVGWPVSGASFESALDPMRREFQRFNVIHKYHRAPDDVDDDLFFVLGHVRPSTLSRPQCGAALAELREEIGRRDPIYLPLGCDDLSLVTYSDRTLPAASSVCVGLTQAARRPELLG